MPGEVFLITDVGSTTTKALLIEWIGDEYRLTHRGEAGTTVEAPYADVMVGVRRAIEEVARSSRRQLLKEGKIVIGPGSCDQFLSTSSAGGGLQVLVCGLAKRVTAESAQRAALGAGAILLDVISVDDGRNAFTRMEAIRQAKPDMVLLAGGVDGGEQIDFAIEFCDMLNSAKPAPRFGNTYTMPVIFAGNNNAAPLVQDTLGGEFDLHVAPNLRPSFSRENLQPARDHIHELFLSHVMAQAPGYSALREQTTAPILPTPLAVGKIMSHLAERDQIDILGVDIGGATTDVFSVLKGKFNRTVSANLGMSYSAGNVLTTAGAENIARWLPFEISLGQLQDEIFHKMINPTSVPATIRDLLIEQALAREALRLSLGQHTDLVVSLPEERSALLQALTPQDGVFVGKRLQTLDLARLGLIVGSGGVLSHAPRRAQAAAMLLDAFQPTGYTFLAVDSIFMMPHLGVLSQLYPEIALQVLDSDCFIPLGPSFSAFEVEDIGKPVVEYRLAGRGGVQQGEVCAGELKVVPLATGEHATIRLKPHGLHNFGGGAGGIVERQVTGGTVGVVIDARGRASLPYTRSVQRSALTSLGAFTEAELQAAERGL